MLIFKQKLNFKMKKIILSALLVLGLSCNIDDQFDDLKQDLNSLNERIDVLQEELGAVRVAVVQLNDIDNELTQLTQAISVLEGNNDFGALISGLASLKDQVDALQNSVGTDNRTLVAQIAALQKDLETAIANDDKLAEEIAAQLTLLEEELENQAGQFGQLATGGQMQDLLTQIGEVQSQLDLLLEQNSFYNGNVVIKSAEDLAFYTEKLQGQPLKYINGFLEVEALGAIQGLSFDDPEIISDFLKTIEVVTRSVYINSDSPLLDLSSLVNVGGIYIVRGADVLDEALTVTGGMVLDYEGDFIYPNLRQVNGLTDYNYNADGILGTIITQLIGGLSGELSTYNYGTIALSNNTAGDFVETKTVDFSGLQMPVRIISETLDELTGNNNNFSSIDGGLNLPEALSINLGLGTTAYVYAPKATYVELGIENNIYNDFDLFDNDFYFEIPVASSGSPAPTYYPGDTNNVLQTYPPYYNGEEAFSYTKHRYSAFIVASKATGAEVVLNGSSADHSIFVLGSKVSAPNLESIGGTSLMLAANINLPSLKSIQDSEDTPKTLNLIFKESIVTININTTIVKDDIEKTGLLTIGEVKYQEET